MNCSFGWEEVKFNNDNWRDLQDNLHDESQYMSGILTPLSEREY